MDEFRQFCGGAPSAPRRVAPLRPASSPRLGAARSGAPRLPSLLHALGFLAALCAGCGSQDQEQNLPLLQVGMTAEVAPLYDDGELQIFEVKKGVAFPILAPSDLTRGELNQLHVEPYGRRPWVTTDDVEVQLSWTLSNLDDRAHDVELLVDPWNEFARYYPGLQLTDADNQEYLPNLSGIDQRYAVGPSSSGDASRVHGTYTFADLKELATDFATVMNLLKNPPPGEADADDDPTVVYANHAFHRQNRSYRDALTQAWVPDVIAGLTGLDVGFRTSEPANLAIEVAIEVVDQNGKRLRPPGSSAPLLPPTENVLTLGVAPP